MAHKVSCFLLGLMMASLAWAQPGIGQWQNVNSFVGVRHVCSAPDQVYAATRMALFSYHKEEFSTTPITKGNGLTDAGISTMAYDPATRSLLVAYTNSAIDIKQGSSLHHIADIKYSNISGDKQIYHIRFSAGRAYLATGFGIVVLNLNRHEIEETYYLGNNGSTATVYDIAFADSLIYAATDHGVLHAPKDSRRLHIREEWQPDTLAPFGTLSVRMLDICRGQLLAAACHNAPDTLTLFIQRSATQWDSLAPAHLRTLRCHNGHVLLNHYSSIDILDLELNPIATLTSLPEFGLAANDADIDADGTLWIGHPWAGILRVPKGYTAGYWHHPEGPNNDDYIYSIHCTHDRTFFCPGGKLPTYQNTYLPPSLAYQQKGEWHQFDFAGAQVSDVLNVAVDPTNRKHASATAWGYGVLDFEDGVLQHHFNQHNTPQLTAYSIGDFTHLRTAGLAYDLWGDLWVTNSLVANGLAVRHRNGEWESFNTSALFSGLADEKLEIDKIICDSVRGYKWFAGRANRIYVHNGSDKMAYINPNNGSKLETHTVTCLVQDRSGDIWFGTDKGLKVIYDGYRAFNNGGHGELSPVTCSNILFSEDGIYEYLMAYESITCLAVDGANRKWVGTSNNGLYLISANGQQEIHHFTTANSPLASDKIVALAVHPETGCVYIGTNMGVQTYRSTATVAYQEPSADIHAFPNPVRPDYDGPIAIKGFTRDAIVHITDARGHVVFATTAHGGQAIWNGRTQAGNPVQSGTYFVFASDQMGSMRSVTKILIIR